MHAHDGGDDGGPTDGEDAPTEGHDVPADTSLGLSVPDEHVAAFVAEAFEDAERSTTWEQAVDAMVAPTARDAFDALSPREQVTEVLGMADSYDERTVELLEGIPTDRGQPSEEGRRDYEEATRLRGNADALRDGVADAYGSGVVDDEALVAAVEGYGFDTTTVARRESLLDDVASAYDFEFRPYGGTLLSNEDEQPAGGPDEEFTEF